MARNPKVVAFQQPLCQLFWGNLWDVIRHRRNLHVKWSRLMVATDIHKLKTSSLETSKRSQRFQRTANYQLHISWLLATHNLRCIIWYSNKIKYGHWKSPASSIKSINGGFPLPQLRNRWFGHRVIRKLKHVIWKVCVGNHGLETMNGKLLQVIRQLKRATRTFQPDLFNIPSTAQQYVPSAPPHPISNVHVGVQVPRKVINPTPPHL